MKYLVVILLILGYKQTDPNLILWSETTKLEWKDFKGKPENHPTRHAMTRAGLQVSITAAGDTLSIKSECIFDKRISWVKNGSQTVQILQHEQLHFDISELLCRRFKKIVKEKASFSKKTATQSINNLRLEAIKQYDKDQKMYDEESYSSIDKQNEWVNKIALELKSLEEFKGPVVKVLLTN